MAMYQNRQMEWIHHSSSLQSMIEFISCYWTWIDLHIAWLALQMLLIIRQSRRSWMVSSIGSLMVFTVCRLYYTINFSPFLLMSFLASDDKVLIISVLSTVELSFPFLQELCAALKSWTLMPPLLGEWLWWLIIYCLGAHEQQSALDPLLDKDCQLIKFAQDFHHWRRIRLGKYSCNKFRMFYWQCANLLHARGRLEDLILSKNIRNNYRDKGGRLTKRVIQRVCVA